MHSHKSHEEVTACALSFGRCWQNAGSVRKDKPDNKPKSAHQEDIEFH